MSKFAKFKTAARGVGLLVAAITLTACDYSPGDLEDTYVPATHYERYPIRVDKQSIRVTVSSKQGRVTPAQAAELANAGRRAQGLASNGTVSVRRPSGGGKSAKVAAEVRSILLQQGVPANRIVDTTYSGSSSSPVEVSFVTTVAVTEECGSWNNLAAQGNNESYDNFGCAHQHNIAAMVANPQDLVVMQPSTPPLAGKLSIAVDDYRGYASDAGASGGGDSSGGSSSSSSAGSDMSGGSGSSSSSSSSSSSGSGDSGSSQ
jgi:pilus assembly protein CpaD